MKPLAERINISILPPSAEDKRADRERLLSAITEETGCLSGALRIGLPLLRELPGLLRRERFQLDPVIAYGDRLPEVLSLHSSRCCGIALDIGTTNMVGALHDLSSGTRLAVMDAPNPQIPIGSDVLTRMFGAMQGKGPELHGVLINGINGLVRRLCSGSGIDSKDIYCMTVAGNTVMMHFFLDLAVENLPVAPYIPAAHAVDIVRAAMLGLELNSAAQIVVFPNAGSYVGGDIIAGIMQSGIHLNEAPGMLIDVGTNVEIVLGCRDWIIVGAGAAGPALEGGIASAGMNAVEGAISEVSIRRTGPAVQDYEVSVMTIGGVMPRGICGSGMIDLIAELFANGIIDGRGKLQDMGEKTVKTPEGPGFMICDGTEGAIVIWEREIDNFIRSKAALFAALQVLLGSVGIGFRDLSMLHVAGAFGQKINVDKAVSIGMLPDLDRSRFRVIGNSALEGAEQLLRNRESVSEIEHIASMITYRELNEDGSFMRHLTAGLFLPHTDLTALKG